MQGLRRGTLLWVSLFGPLMALLVVVAPPAQAAQYWETEYNPVGPGYITAYGTVNYRGKEAFENVTVLEDVCGAMGDGDGFGLQVRGLLNTPVIALVHPIYTNQQGCGSVDQRGPTNIYAVFEGERRNINNVYFTLFLTDGDDRYPVDQSQCMDNPNTAANNC